MPPVPYAISPELEDFDPIDHDAAVLPPRFIEGRGAIRAGIAKSTAVGISDSTLLAILLSETLPRLVNAYGPGDAAIILTRLAHDIGRGLAPNTRRQ